MTNPLKPKTNGYSEGLYVYCCILLCCLQKFKSTNSYVADAEKLRRWLWIAVISNPLSPNIDKQIVLTGLYIFP